MDTNIYDAVTNLTYLVGENALQAEQCSAYELSVMCLGAGLLIAVLMVLGWRRGLGA